MGWIDSTQTSLLISHVVWANLLVYDKIRDFSFIFGNTRQQGKEEKINEKKTSQKQVNI